mmetsp:Transcript_12125/g.35439  ORF Transcript_12125/g.35439 Transcript_12125/m.35439 type:complete len:990 (-) Transcript_12125:254-3223(-)
MSLPTLPALDSLRSAAGTSGSVTRAGNVDVISDSSGAEVALCHIPQLVPFTVGGSGAYRNVGAYEGAAAVALAAQHLNSGDGSVVTEVRGLDKRCNVRVTTSNFDTELSERVAVDQLIELTNEGGGGNETTANTCALLGAALSGISIPTSIISGLRGYTQVSPVSTSSALDNPAQYPLFARTVPSDDGTAVAAIIYLSRVLGVKHLGILHVNDAYGSAFARGLSEAAKKYAPDMDLRVTDVPNSASDKIMGRAVDFLVNTEFRYFFAVVLITEDFNNLMTMAYERGIAGTGQHTWMFSDGAGSALADPKDREGKVHRASRGAGMIQAEGGLPSSTIGGPRNKYDKFVEALRGVKNPTDIDYLSRILPKTFGSTDEETRNIHSAVLEGADFLSSPSIIAPFLYDATIALGLAGCQATATNANGVGQYFGGAEQFKTMVNLEFDGASGTVEFDNITGTRTPESAIFSVQNFIDLDYGYEEPNGSISSTVQLKSVLTDIFTSGEWSNIEPYRFSDGTTVIPSDLPYLETDNNYLSTGLRAAGLAMCALSILLSAAAAIWTFRNRKGNIVRASQPVFLFLLIGGVAIAASSIIPLSIDDSIASQNICDGACMAFPWLLFSGFAVVLSSLFTKTHRVNVIFRNPSFKRVQVTPKDVAKPMMAILLANVLVLGSWTGLHPLQWVRRVTSTDQFGRASETFGLCSSDMIAPYLASLAVINFGSLVYALYEAYAARNLSLEFAESEYIFKAMAAILLVSFVGIPVFVITSGSDGAGIDANYFVTAAVVFVACCAVILLIFVPKMIYHARKKNKGSMTDVIRASANASKTKRWSSDSSGMGSAKLSSTTTKRLSNESFQSNTSQNFPTNPSMTSVNEQHPLGEEGVKVLVHPKKQEELVKNLKDEIRALKRAAQDREVAEEEKEGKLNEEISMLKMKLKDCKLVGNANRGRSEENDKPPVHEYFEGKVEEEWEDEHGDVSVPLVWGMGNAPIVNLDNV